jgi:transposase
MQEASNDNERPFPSTLEECYARIAILQNIATENAAVAAQYEQVVAQHEQVVAHYEATIKSKDALLDAKDNAIDASLKKQDQLQTTIDEHERTIERLLGIYRKRRERSTLPTPLLAMMEAGIEDEEDEAMVEVLTEVQEGLITLSEQLSAVVDAKQSKPRKKRSHDLPRHWPRVEVPYVETDPANSHCDQHGPREIMGYETREKAVMKPAKFYVQFTRVPKYKCQGHPECGIAQQAAPEGLVKGDKIDTSIAAQITVQKYAHHVPVYRTEDIFASAGWVVGRGTLLNIMCSMAYLFEGFYQHLRKEMISKASLIATDDTVVKLLLPDYIPPPKPGDPWSKRIHEVLSKAYEQDKKSVNARMWAYRSDGVCPWDIYDFTISRHRDGPERFLGDFHGGTLLGDCYGGYESLRVAKNHAFKLAACNAHARRKIYEAQSDHPKECPLLLAIYRELYDVEAVLKDKPPEEVLRVRRELSTPLFERMKELIAKLQGSSKALPKSKLGKALSYIENNWNELTAYLNISDCPIDNNACEQLMKRTATGRKNWLFIGSIEAGYRAAILSTICATAHRHNLDVYAYVKEVADQLLSGNRDYESMQPENWAKTHPHHVRIYRQEEARYKADRKAKRLNERRREFKKQSKGNS